MMDSGNRENLPDVCEETFCGKKQERSIATRQELIDAARCIFARDGFEAARLQDIAAAANKTRGAFYSHFHDKEDVFFAIFEEDVKRDSQAQRALLEKSSTFEERVSALVKSVEAIIHDKSRVLLNIEFKMYAIRHPHKRKRLAALHGLMCTQCPTSNKFNLLPELQSDDPDEQRSRAAHFGALLDGLVLNHYFDPAGIDEELLHRQLALRIREFMSPTSSWRKHRQSNRIGTP